MQAIPAHHTNASIFFGHAMLAYLIFNNIRFRSILVIREKPKAASSSDQYSQSRINYASSKYTQVRSKSSLDKGNQLHFTNDQDYAITLHLVFTAGIPSHSNMANTGHSCAYQYKWPCLRCFLFLSADDCRRAQFVPL